MMSPSRVAADALERTLRELVAYNVKRRREELGLSLSKAAWLAGINRKSWLAIERGESALQMRTLARLVIILSTDHIALMSESRPGHMANAQPAARGAAGGGA